MKKLLLIAGGLVGLGALAVVALVVVTLIRDDDPELLTSAPEIPTPAASAAATPARSATAPATTGGTGATGGAGGTGAAAPAGTLRFVVDPAQSSATYVVSEKLSTLPVQSDAVGVTQDTPEGDITGELLLNTSGLAQASKSTFRVDLNTLKTDESRRDAFVRSNVLRTGQANNRYASFSIDSVSGFPANYVEGTEVSLTLTGQMTINGTTKPVTFQVKARRLSDTLTATADTTFNMSEFGITPPNVPIARSEDGVRLQVVLVTKRAAG